MREGWTYKQIGEIADITDYVANGSFASLRENVSYKSEKDYAVLVRLADFSNEFDASKFVYVDEHAYNFLAKSKLYGGEIIMSNVGSIGKLFICPDLGMPMSLAPNTIVINTKNNRFYAYLFASSHCQAQIKSISSQTSLPKFNKTTFKKLSVPVPPIQEQEKIVAELDCLTGIIEKKKQQLEELDKLAQSIFYDMFGDPITNEKGWKKMLLGEICVPKKSIARASKTYKANETIHYIDIASIDNNQALLTGTTPFVFAEAPSRAQQKVEKGDVLISLVRPNLRNVAMVEYDDSLLVASSGFCVLRAKDSNPRFIKAFALTDGFTRYLADRTAGANYPAVREEDIRACSIGVPPLDLQNEFAQKVEAIEKQKELVKRSIVETETLFNSRMDYWFNN